MEERFMLVHSFRAFSVCLSGSIALRPDGIETSWQKGVEEESCSPYGSRNAKQAREEGARNKIYLPRVPVTYFLQIGSNS
jgi:hypothetical protein